MAARPDLIAAVDAGTTGTRCCVIDARGETVSSAYHPVATIYPRPGLVEQDPRAFVDLTVRAVGEAVRSESVDPARIAGLCITVQRNTFVPMAADGSFLSNMIVWQDQRGEEVRPWMLERLTAHGMTVDDLYLRNGQPFASFQFGFKALWLRRFREDLYERTYRLVTPQACLTHAFGAKGYLEERDNRSFWLVADADTGEIDPGLCEVFDIRPDIFPEAVAAGTLAGTVSAEAAAATGLLSGTPIYVGSGDQNCGALGAGNYGTSDIVSLCMGTAGLCIAYAERPIRHPRGMCQIQGHPAGGYLIEGHSSSCMSSYRWAGDLLVSGDCDGKDRNAFIEELARAVPAGSHGVVFLPFLQGAACPHYDDAARGAYVGMSLAHGRGDMLRAMMEGICFENRMMLETLFEADIPHARALRVIGGASNSELMNQMQADIYGIPVETITAKESTALGAAIIGAVASGVFGSYREASDGMTHVRRRYEPDAGSVQAYDEVYRMWDECYRGLSRGSFGMIHGFQAG